TEFGHRFLFNNRVNADIDTYGLFHWHYLERNLDAALLKLPLFNDGQLLRYSPWGLSLFLTLPVLVLALAPSVQPKRVYGALAATAGLLVLSAKFQSAEVLRGIDSVGGRPAPVLVALVAVLVLFAWLSKLWLTDPQAPRLLVPVLVTLLACAIPGLLYQNTGYAQFGFRFSLDYTPYVALLVVLGGWRLKQPLVMGVLAVAGLVNFWGAVAFRGYTEGVRQWP
ncbi:MAG: hypothetical protein JNG84_09245, partial [Archangium sp.]|nr:hypothetical protein [Archangium sp.]